LTDDLPVHGGEKPKSVDFGTGSTNKLGGSKQRVFSADGTDWNGGFWHTRLDYGATQVARLI
jgi:hypothetical protein